METENLITKEFLGEGKMYAIVLIPTIVTDPTSSVTWTKNKSRATRFSFSDAYAWVRSIGDAAIMLVDEN